MKTWLTADTHFGHANIIGLCHRPFETVEEMDATLEANWNAAIAPGDTVWHLGDFAWRQDAKTLRALFDRLHGVKRLIRGNHDGAKCLQLPWDAQYDYFELLVPKADDKTFFILSHYAMEDWVGMLRGTYMMHGHSHGALPARYAKRLDVGVDPQAFCPLTVQDAMVLCEPGTQP